MEQWACDWDLQINFNKTLVLHMGDTEEPQALVLEPIRSPIVAPSDRVFNKSVLCLIAASSAQTSSPNLPDCLKLGYKKPLSPLIRRLLFKEVDSIKKAMRYNCQLEDLAYNLVKEPPESIGNPYKFTFSDGSEEDFNLRKVVDEWKEQLIKGE
ncbi:hypothetical protein ANCDUO_04523 [Ancylostoma duodenale]|uniref:Uncharacterized protein n=1 Tax=Ancylostoma duodenale TaxID=51022 RepID=A0A0C2GUR1_9BILA|nr:hypothetical protein ANCDUO_04523 [Ancylostoma duodenale]